jgi:CheY-like chemotaxis protein
MDTAEAKSMRILIADDEVNVRYALSVLIRERSTWKLIGVARQSSELNEKLETLHPDLILVDAQLPGLYITDLVRRTKAMPHPPLLMMICRDQEGEKEALYEGVNYVITKVDPPDRLLTALTESQSRISEMA